jgi:hypothetical protein
MSGPAAGGEENFEIALSFGAFSGHSSMKTID